MVNDPARILIVEDEQAIQLLLRRVVELMGHTAFVAGDGASALALANQHSPQLIISDLSLPGSLHGVELVQALHTAHPTCPIIVTTGDMSPARIAALSAAGVNDVLSKPFDIPVARALISSRLSGG